MTKEEICYQLAQIYANNMFSHYLQHQPRYEVDNLAAVTRKLFCYFEESYNTYSMMDDHEFAFILETMNKAVESEKREK